MEFQSKLNQKKTEKEITRTKTRTLTHPKFGKMNSIVQSPENKRNRRLTLTVETFDQNLLKKVEQNDSSSRKIEEGFNESLSSE